MAKSTLIGRAVKITFAEDGAEVLVGEFAINCPACGQVTLRFAGHHMRSMRDALIEWIDRYPELTGTDEDVQVIGRMQTGGMAPHDPEMN